jgi:hypothetical protein
MRFRGLLIAAVVLAILAGGVYWSNKSEKAKADKPAAGESPKLVSIPEDQVQQIEIKKTGGDDTILRKNGSGKWEMVSPKPLSVDQDAVTSMTSTLASLASDRLVEDKTSDLNQYGLGLPGLTVDVKKKDGKTTELAIGDETPTSGGFYAKLQGDPRIFTIASYTKTSLDKSSNDLRDKRLLTFDSDKLVRLELNAKKQDIEFAKNNQNDWQILRPRPLRADGGQVEDLIRKIKDAKMDLAGTEEDQKKAVAGFAKAAPLAEVKVTDAAGTQELTVRKDKDSNYYAKSSAVDGVYKIGKDLGDGLDKGLDDFRNKKLFDFGFNDPTKVEVRDASKLLAVQKSGDKWMSGGKEMTSSDVQAVIDKLRDLSATKFADQGFAPPAVLEATVVSSDGKRTEKVLISKKGTSYFAKRENEPAIYELDGSAVEAIQNAVAGVKEAQPPKQQKKK